MKAKSFTNSFIKTFWVFCFVCVYLSNTFSLVYGRELSCTPTSVYLVGVHNAYVGNKSFQTSIAPKRQEDEKTRKNKELYGERAAVKLFEPHFYDLERIMKKLGCTLEVCHFFERVSSKIHGNQGIDKIFLSFNYNLLIAHESKFSATGDLTLRKNVKSCPQMSEEWTKSRLQNLREGIRSRFWQLSQKFKKDEENLRDKINQVALKIDKYNKTPHSPYIKGLGGEYSSLKEKKEKLEEKILKAKEIAPRILGLLQSPILWRTANVLDKKGINSLYLIDNKDTPLPVADRKIGFLKTLLHSSLEE